MGKIKDSENRAKTSKIVNKGIIKIKREFPNQSHQIIVVTKVCWQETT